MSKGTWCPNCQEAKSENAESFIFYKTEVDEWGMINCRGCGLVQEVDGGEIADRNFVG